MTHIWKDSWLNYRSLNKFWRLNITVFYFRLEEDLVLQKFRTEYLFLSYAHNSILLFRKKLGFWTLITIYILVCIFLTFRHFRDNWGVFKNDCSQHFPFYHWLLIGDIAVDIQNTCTFTFVTSNHWLSGTTLCTIMQQYSYKWLMSRNCINKLLPFGSIKPKPFREWESNIYKPWSCFIIMKIFSNNTNDTNICVNQRFLYSSIKR